MKFDISELDKLASRLDAAATVSSAKAVVHKEHGERDEAEREENRSTSGRYYAEICREAARRLRIKHRTGAFVAPSFEEVIAYAKEKHPKWPAGDVLSWWNHFDSCGWIIGRGKPMRNWKTAADNGFKNWREKVPERSTKKTDGDPAGWREWLTGMGRKYEEHRYAPPHLRDDFHRRK